MRSNRWWASQRSPSTISARIERVAGPDGSVPAARKSPPINATRTLHAADPAISAVAGHTSPSAQG
ncbi:hypothetical protein ACLQ24_16070 [Micromonospora sp. DT4]|uniref:hypothetical protein n=1 Tax=Micromonospora sp. DT4 TaxID=3393438 RepID=UPI003CE9B1A3